MKIIEFVVVIFLAKMAWADSPKEGGVNGGGGGLLPATPISKLQASKIIREGRKELRLIYNLEIKDFNKYGPSSDYLKLLYGNTKTILDALESTDFEIPFDKPCYDSSNNEVDGSYLESKPNVICMSAFRLAPKLSSKVAKMEILSLISHELAHQLGANETQAVDYQRLIASKFENISNDSAQKLLDEAVNTFDRIRLLTSYLLKAMDTMSDKDLTARFAELRNQWDRISQLKQQGEFSLYTDKGSDYFQIQSDRIWMAELYLTESTDSFAKEFLVKIFQDKKSVTHEELQKALDLTFSKTQYGSEVVKRIASRQDLRELLEEMLPYAYNNVEYMTHLGMNIQFPFMEGPWNRDIKNSWEAFQGKYNVVSGSCTDTSGNTNSWMPTSIEIHKYQDRLFMKTEYSGESNDDGLYSGAMSTLGGGTVLVSGSESKPVVTTEFGTKTWDRYFLKTISMSRVVDGFTLKRTVLNRKWEAKWDPNDTTVVAPFDSVQKCEIKLQKE